MGETESDDDKDQKLLIDPVVVLDRVDEQIIKYYEERRLHYSKNERAQKKVAKKNLRDVQRVDFRLFDQYKKSRNNFLKKKKKSKLVGVRKREQDNLKVNSICTSPTKKRKTAKQKKVRFLDQLIESSPSDVMAEDKMLHEQDDSPIKKKRKIFRRPVIDSDTESSDCENFTEQSNANHKKRKKQNGIDDMHNNDLITHQTEMAGFASNKVPTHNTNELYQGTSACSDTQSGCDILGGIMQGMSSTYNTFLKNSKGTSIKPSASKQASNNSAFVSNQTKKKSFKVKNNHFVPSTNNLEDSIHSPRPNINTGSKNVAQTVNMESNSEKDIIKKIYHETEQLLLKTSKQEKRKKPTKKDDLKGVKISGNKDNIKGKILSKLPKYEQHRLLYTDEKSSGKGYSHCKSIESKTVSDNEKRDSHAAKSLKELNNIKKVKVNAEHSSKKKHLKGAQKVKSNNAPGMKINEAFSGPVFPFDGCTYSTNKTYDELVKFHSEKNNCESGMALPCLNETHISETSGRANFLNSNMQLEIQPQTYGNDSLKEQQNDKANELSPNSMQHSSYSLPPYKAVLIANYTPSDNNNLYLRSVIYNKQSLQMNNVIVAGNSTPYSMPTANQLFNNQMDTQPGILLNPHLSVLAPNQMPISPDRSKVISSTITANHPELSICTPKAGNELVKFANGPPGISQMVSSEFAVRHPELSLSIPNASNELDKEGTGIRISQITNCTPEESRNGNFAIVANERQLNDDGVLHSEITDSSVGHPQGVHLNSKQKVIIDSLSDVSPRVLKQEMNETDDMATFQTDHYIPKDNENGNLAIVTNEECYTASNDDSAATTSTSLSSEIKESSVEHSKEAHLNSEHKAIIGPLTSPDSKVKYSACNALCQEIDAIAILAILDLNGNIEQQLKERFMIQQDLIQKIDKLENSEGKKSKLQIKLHLKTLELAKSLLCKYGSFSKIVEHYLEEPVAENKTPSDTSNESEKADLSPISEKHINAKIVKAEQRQMSSCQFASQSLPPTSTDSGYPSSVSASSDADSANTESSSSVSSSLLNALSSREMSPVRLKMEQSSPCMFSSNNAPPPSSLTEQVETPLSAPPSLPTTSQHSEISQVQLKMETFNSCMSSTSSAPPPSNPIDPLQQLESRLFGEGANIELTMPSGYVNPPPLPPPPPTESYLKELLSVTPRTEINQNDLRETPSRGSGSQTPSRPESARTHVDDATPTLAQIKQERLGMETQEKSPCALAQTSSAVPFPSTQLTQRITPESSMAIQSYNVRQIQTHAPPNRTVPFNTPNNLTNILANLANRQQTVMQVPLAARNYQENPVFNSNHMINVNNLFFPNQINLSQAMQSINSAPVPTTVPSSNYIMNQNAPLHSSNHTVSTYSGRNVIGSSQLAQVRLPEPMLQANVLAPGQLHLQSPVANALNKQALDASIYMRCAVCNNPATLRCKKCARVAYCNTDCAKLYWQQKHKSECTPLPNTL